MSAAEMGMAETADLRARLAPLFPGREISLRSAAAPVASPLHRAVASACVLAQPDGAAPLFLKLAHPDMQGDLLDADGAAARLAARAGVAPALVLAQPGLLGFAYLAPPWRYARTGDLQPPATLAAVLAAKKRLHEGDILGRRFCPFTRIAQLQAQAEAAQVPLPAETAPLLRQAALIQQALIASGMDLRFCHNHATASNIMLNGSQVMLVDFDIGGDNDPWYDVGALLNEVCDFDAPRRAAIEAYAGRCDEALFARCRLYGAVDDLMWGLWGLTRAVTAPRDGIEFWKYGTWRLFQARTTMTMRGFELWLRTV
ncbi:phosphotransferase family protein [Acidocella facilis]|uniref:phosphotransferase family protein n=1 Tax=Acidocella facilis TaxID=525 RepID=UPI001F44F685|nr:phosphotransferase [Acidocella facilis]